MSAATGTRIFGVKVGIDPKILVGGLVVLAGILFWVNSSSDDTPASVTTGANPAAIAPSPATSPARSANLIRRGGPPVNDRGVLRQQVVDGTRGDVDPTLRLDLLKKLSALQMPPAGRSLFEVGATPAVAPPPVAIKGPKIPVTPPVLPGAAGPGMGGINTAVNIPLKYYGFVKPSVANSINSGLFLNGDDVLVAIEGQSLRVNGRQYLVVELSPNSARLEDTQLKQGQTLPVVPVALQ